MRIDILKQFLTVCSEGSINTAAQQLYISQQGLDGAIKRLEKELNLVLFERSKNGVSPTQEGLLLKKYAEQIVQSFENFELEVAQLQLKKTEKEYTITIAANPMLTRILSDFIFQFNGEKNHITCRFFDISNDDIPQALLENNYDIGLICYIDDPDFLLHKPVLTDLTQFPVMISPLTLSFGKHHPLASRKSIAKKDFTLFNDKLTITNNTRAYDDINSLDCILLCSNDFKLHENYLRNNDCACLLPAFLSEQYFDKKFIQVCYFEPAIHHKTIMLLQETDTLTPQQLLFYNALKRYFQTMQ